jgi:hypothetical protein
MEYLKLAHQHGLPILDIARRTVEKIYEDGVLKVPL